MNFRKKLNFWTPLNNIKKNVNQEIKSVIKTQTILKCKHLKQQQKITKRRKKTTHHLNTVWTSIMKKCRNNYPEDWSREANQTKNLWVKKYKFFIAVKPGSVALRLFRKYQTKVYCNRGVYLDTGQRIMLTLILKILSISSENLMVSSLTPNIWVAVFNKFKSASFL